MDKLLTVTEAAELLHLAPGTVYHLISRRIVPCVKLSKRCVRFRQSELEQWVSSHSENCAEKSDRKTTKKI
jgi:excisionase family DNA binding protein